MLRLIRGGALRGGRGGNLPFPLMAFLAYMLINSPHTDISLIGGHLACGLLSQQFIARPVNLRRLGSIIDPALSLLVKQLVIGQTKKALNFSAFH